MTQQAEPGERSLADRYGRPTGSRRRTGLVVVALAAVALAAWAIWAAVGQASHGISAIVQSYRVVSPHSLSVTVQITRGSRNEVQCVVSALASDHSTVGETVVTVAKGGSGTTTLGASVKTERLASAADIGSCHER